MQQGTEEFNPEDIATFVELHEQQDADPDVIPLIDLGLHYGRRSFQMVDGDGIQGRSSGKEN